MNNKFTISIITPCLNRAEFITESIESVTDQDYPYIEHMIIDGGSTDGTLKILSQFPHLNVISEPDNGVYDAINKGINIANGDIIGFLNTDDYYEPNIFASIVQNFLSEKDLDAVVGGADIFFDGEKKKRTILATYDPPSNKNLISRLTQGVPIFNAWFFNHELIKKIGGFNTQYMFAADRDFLIRMALSDCNYKSVYKIVYHYREHPDSLTISQKDTGESNFMVENLDIAEKYLYQLPKQDLAIRREFEAWHSQITVDQTFSAIKKLAFARIFRYVIRGLSYDNLWLKTFLERFIFRISLFFEKKVFSKL